MMNSINSTDRLYLTVMTGRKTLASLSVSGVSSLNEVYRRVIESANGQKGIVTLYLRNSTQGWTQQHTMVLNRTLALPASGRDLRKCQHSYPSLFDADLFES